MLIDHKIRKGETLGGILQKQSVRDWKAVWALPDNKSLKSKRKTPDKLQPGDVIKIPNGKAKVYTLNYKGKIQLFSEKEWKEFTSQVTAQMRKKVLKPLRMNLDVLDAHFMDLRNIKKENPIATWIIEVTAWTDLSDKEKIAAARAMAAFESALSSGDMNAIPKTMKTLENALDAYVREVNSYNKDFLGGASKAIFVTKLTRDASFIIAGAIAGVIVAPAGATVGTMVKVGIQVGATTGFTKSVSGEIGNALAGNDLSAKTVTWNIVRDTFTSGMMGAINGAAGALISGAIAPHLARTFAKSGAVTKLAEGLVRKNSSGIDKLTGGVLSRLVSQRGAAIATKEATLVIAKIMTSVTISSITTTIKAYLIADKRNLKYAVQKTMRKTNGKESLDQFAGKMVGEIETDGLFDRVFMDLVKQNAKKLKKELEAREQ